MNALKKLLLGDNPKTTIVGYLLAILVAIQPLLEANASTADVVNAAVGALFTALLGRVAGDSKPKQDPPPASPNV